MDEPQLVNDAPYEGGWMIKIQPDDPAAIDTLMTAEQYADQVAGASYRARPLAGPKLTED